MTTLIREDRHSPYVKVGGYIARPVFPRGYSHAYPDHTHHGVGEKVYAVHRGGPCASVGGETWFLHGCYLGTDLGSEDLFKPDYEEWPE